MEQIGYSIIDDQNTEVLFWGDTKGQMMGVPNPMGLPNGAVVYCAEAGSTYQGYKLVPRWLDEGGPSITSDGTKVTVLRVTPPSVIAELARQAAFAADVDRVDLLTRVKNSTPEQIDNYIETNVTSLATAKVVLKMIIKLIALDARS